MMLLELMAPSELKEAIEYLKMRLTECASVNGFSERRTIEISQRLDLYLARYTKIKNSNDV